MSHPDFEDLRPDFGEVMDLLTEGPFDVPVEQPGEDVWEAIATGLTPSEGATDDGARSAAPEPRADSVPPGSDDVPESSDVDGPFSTEPDDDKTLQAQRASFSHRNTSIGKRFAIMTAVAAAILLVAVPLTLALGGDSIDQRAELLALGSSNGVGVAELTDDGSLEVRLEGLEPLEGAVYELWLLDLEGDELQDLRSLGNVAEDGTFSIPEDLDIDEFSVVDVSIEPNDGDETHSGNSVLRGSLEKQ